MIEFKASGMKIYDAKLMKVGEYNLNDTVITTELDTNSLSKEKLSFTNKVTFEASDVEFCSLPLYTTFIDKPFNLGYSIPIMIQARWHKKKRINKKWLKRYGMKKDSVLVKCDVESIDYNTDYEPCYLNEHIECNMTLNNMKYKFRQDQMRRNLKIEMCD